MGVRWRILRVIGRRPFVAFALVTFLVGALLATVNLTSRYAVKQYVDNQLRRTPWDIVLYQRAAPGQTLRLITDQVSTLQGIARVERVMFLRALFPEGGEVIAEVDGKQLIPSWLCVLAASDLSILPPEVALALGRDAKDGAVLALTGPEQSPTGHAFLELQGRAISRCRWRCRMDGAACFERPSAASSASSATSCSAGSWIRPGRSATCLTSACSS